MTGTNEPTRASVEKDRQIIQELQRNARLSNVAIAKKVGLSEGAVRRRIDKLVTSGQIHFAAIPGPSYLGRSIHAIIRIQSEPAHTEALVDELSKMSELSYVYHCTGQFDLMVVGYFRSNDEIRDFKTARLGGREGLREMETQLVLRVAKRAYEWPRPAKSAGTD